ncbi:pirin family protein [Micromonospora psammae]|uniref:pirin family protein n=1 Tax=Micromonospora sp. CPCC 205556 TaxID=3122398 RepID=UPI002FEEB0D9
MPAITVDDVLVLPRLPRLDETTTRYRSVRRVITAPRGFEGEGFPVRRAFAGVPMTELDPFIHLDQMGEVDYAPGEPKGTSWHPHRGFETVTYMIDGIMDHQDSHGGGGTITNGDTQWMTAGRGLLHIEAPPEKLVRSGGLFHGLQLWVNLPAAHKMMTPRYQDIRGRQAALLTTPDGGALIRVIAGEVAGHQGPGSTHTPITIAHVTLQPGAELSLPWRSDFNALVYVLGGRGTVGTDRRPFGSGQLAVHGQGDALRVTADARQDANTPAMDLYIMGGQPIREPVAHYGPFVMNTRAELVQAFEDYQAGKLGVIPAKRLPHTAGQGKRPTGGQGKRPQNRGRGKRR